MLEVFEKSLCTVCLHLKCSCSKDRNKIDNKILNGTTSEENDTIDGWVVQGDKDVDSKVKENEEDEEFDDVDQNDSIAPPASSLPKPKWDSPKKGGSSSTPEKEPVHPDIGAWIEASRAEAKIIKEPIILQNLHYIDIQKKSHNIQINGNGVDAFFKYFKMSNDTAVTYMSTKLAAACSTPVRKNYTYF